MRPLAERMRPEQLKDYIGQQHLVGPGTVLHQAIHADTLPSVILWGPPGVGKTTLANIIANDLKRPFHTLSAINSGVKDIRETIQKAEKQQFFNRPNPILFIDEIHRFSKSQQDSLLGAVEKGTVTLIGATTENPSFEIIPALLSRCQVYQLHHLNKEELIQMVDKAIKKDELLSKQHIEVEEYDALLLYSGGDGRKLYNVLELVTNYNENKEQPFVIDNALVQRLLQNNQLSYDKGGDQHYDIASAMIKAIRGSDPDAAVYWMARMLEGGEDIKFIARRILISAAEDIGLANPNALLLANSAFQAVQAVGMPEGRIILSQVVIYLASSPKSNAAYLAINEAQRTIRQTGRQNVPLHLRNAPTKLMKDLNYGGDYEYPHDFPEHFVSQNYLPDTLQNLQLYFPQNNASEEKLRQFLSSRWEKRKY